MDTYTMYESLAIIDFNENFPNNLSFFSMRRNFNNHAFDFCFMIVCLKK